MRPQCRTLFEDDGVHAHDAVVEQVGLHHAATVDGASRAQANQVGFREPTGLTPDSMPDLGAQRPQPEIHDRRAGGSAGEPRAATVSTKASATSFVHTNADHSGRSPALMRPTISHFAATDTVPATTPAAR